MLRLVRSLLVALALPCAGAALAAPLAPGPLRAAADAPQDPDEDEMYAAPLTVRGQLVDEEGAPVVGVVPTIHGWRSNSQSVERWGVPAHWRDPEVGATDAEGRFEVTLEPPRAFQFSVRVEAEGYGQVSWRWSTQRQNTSELDLGRAVLERPGVVEGVILNRDGELLIEGWSVMASDTGPRSGLRSSTTVHAPVDPETGLFRIDGLPPGTLRLTATHLDGTRFSKEPVVTNPDTAVRLPLVYSGPDAENRILLTLDTSPYRRFRPEEGCAHAISASGERFPIVPVPGRSSEWHVVDLEPGIYTVEIADPRYEPWRQEDVRTGTSLVAHLTGSAGLVLRVSDPDGNPVTHAGVTLVHERRDWPVNTATLLPDGSPLPAGGRFPGIVPGDWLVEVTPVEGPASRVRVPEVGPGETRELHVRLGRAGRITGCVRDRDGSPLAGVRVLRTRGDVHGHDGPPGTTSSTTLRDGGARRPVVVRFRDEETTTDADGRYAFEGLVTGPHALRAQRGRFAFDDHVVEVREGELTEQDLVLPDTGSVHVQLRLPDGVEATQLRIRAEPLSPSDGQRLAISLEGMQRRQEAGTDDRTFLDLPAGGARIVVERTPPTTRGTGPKPIFVEEFEVEAGVRKDLTCDLRATYPSDGRVRAWLDGETREAVEVGLVRESREGPHHASLSGTAFRWSNEEGGWSTQPTTLPGTYRVVVQDRTAGWEWTAPEPLVVRPNTAFELEVEVPIVHRTLRVVDGEGRPLARTLVSWSPGNGGFGDARATTDEEGRLPLVLPEGEYRILRVPVDLEPERPIPSHLLRVAPTLSFEAGDGELEVTLGE